MYLTDLSLDPVGDRPELSVDSLAPGLTVIHVPREAGASTPVEFLRSTVFGRNGERPSHFSGADARRSSGTVILRDNRGQRITRQYENGARSRTILESALGQADGDAAFATLYGAYAPALLEKIFIIDFERPAQLEELLNHAAQCGMDVTDRDVDVARQTSLERELDDARRSLSALPAQAESWELLLDRRRQIADEIESLEARQRRADADRERSRIRRAALLADLEQQLAALRREATALDGSAQSLLERRRLLEIDLTALRSEQHARPSHDEISAIDGQLKRWQSALRDFALAKSDSSGGSPGTHYETFGQIPEQADARRHLRSLESIAQNLQQVVGAPHETGPIACSCREVRSACEESLGRLREGIYSVCHSLSVWQAHVQQRLAITESQQFARCEAEMQIAVAHLAERRRQLIAGVERPPTDLHPDHAYLCQCNDHPRWQAPAPSRTREDSLIAALHDIDTELRGLAEQRERCGRQLADLAARAEQARHADDSEQPQLNGLPAELSAKRALLLDIEQSRQSWQRQRELHALVAELEAKLRALCGDSHASPVLADASRFAQQLSAGELRRVTRNSAGAVLVETPRGQNKQAPDLANADRDQVALAVGLALAKACRQQGTCLPVVLNAPLDPFTDKQTAEAMRYLRDCGHADQILCFTEDDRDAQAARAANVPVARMIVVPQLPVAPPQLQPAAEPLPSAAFVPAPAPAAPRLTILQTTAPNLEREPYIIPWHSPWDAEEFPGELSDRTRETGERLAMPVRLDAADSGMARKFHATPDSRSDSDEDAEPGDLSDDDPIERLSFLNGKDVERLRAAGVTSVGDFLNLSPHDLSARLLSPLITHDALAAWQARARQRLGRRSWSGRSRGPRDSDRAPRVSHAAEPAPREARTRAAVYESQAEVATLEPRDREKQLRFYLHRHDPVDAAPSIGTSMAKRLTDVGVATVSDLLSADPQQVAEQLGHARTKTATVRQWQQQAELVCRIPQLRGHDAQILVAVGVTSPEELAAYTPDSFWPTVESFIGTAEGKRLLRSSEPPDLEEVSDWIEYARHARPLAAA